MRTLIITKNYPTNISLITDKGWLNKFHIIKLASGTPPTRVLTVNNPQLAASNIAMQNASVKELSRSKKKEIRRQTNNNGRQKQE